MTARRPLIFRIVANPEHPLSERLWKRVEHEYVGSDPLVPPALIRMFEEEDAPYIEVPLDEAEAVRKWCAERSWWPERGPAPLTFQKVPSQRGPEPKPETDARKAGILVPLSTEEREALNAEAKRLNMTQKELARRKILKPYLTSTGP